MSLSDFFSERSAATALAVVIASGSLTGCFASLPVENVVRSAVNQSTRPLREGAANELKGALRLRHCRAADGTIGTVVVGKPCPKDTWPVAEPRQRTY